MRFRTGKILFRIMAIVIAAGVLISAAWFSDEAYATTKATVNISVTNFTSGNILTKGSKLKLNCVVTQTRENYTTVIEGASLTYKSSDKKIATVSKKGVIKAKKTGTAKITVTYKENKKKVKTTLTVNVYTKGLKISGKQYYNSGRKAKLTAKVKSSGKTTTKVRYYSDDPTIAKVTKKGKVTAVGNGVVTITAVSTDNSKKYGTYTIYVHKYTSSETNWIAHRGLHTTATENTAEAFRQAGINGFWGTECDIWETKHERPEEESLPENPSTSTSDSASVAALSSTKTVMANRLITLIDALPDNTMDIIDVSSKVTQAQSYYNTIKASFTARELYALRLKVTDERLTKLFSAVADIEEYDSFDLVINHDSDFSRIYGLTLYEGTRKKVLGDTVRDSAGNDVDTYARFTSSEIKSVLGDVCFFNEYLSICNSYNMVSVVELKDKYMSDAAVKKTVDMIYSLRGRTGLQSVRFISFYANDLKRVKEYSKEKYNITPFTTIYTTTKAQVASVIQTAITNGFSGVTFRKDIITAAYAKTCYNSNLVVGVYTMEDVSSDDKRLYKFLVSGDYSVNGVNIIESLTTNAKFFEE